MLPIGSYIPIHLDTPMYLDTSHMFRVLIGYVLCYIIKCFSTLETVMGVLSDLGGIHVPPIFIYPLYVSQPPYVWTSPIYLDAPICLDILICLMPLYVWIPLVCLDTPVYLDASYILTPHMFRSPYLQMHSIYLEGI